MFIIELCLTFLFIATLVRYLACVNCKSMNLITFFSIVSLLMIGISYIVYTQGLLGFMIPFLIVMIPFLALVSLGKLLDC